MRQYALLVFLLALTWRRGAALLSDSDFVTFVGNQPNYPDSAKFEEKASESDCLNSCRSNDACTFASFDQHSRQCFTTKSQSVLDSGLYANVNVTSFFKTAATGDTGKVLHSFAFFDAAFAAPVVTASRNSFAACLQLCAAGPACSAFRFRPADRLCHLTNASAVAAGQKVAARAPGDNSLYFEKLRSPGSLFNVFFHRYLDPGPELTLGKPEKKSMLEADQSCVEGPKCKSFNYNFDNGTSQEFSTMFKASSNRKDHVGQSVAYVEMKVVKKAAHEIFDRSPLEGQIVLSEFPELTTQSPLADNVDMVIPEGMRLGTKVTRNPSCDLELRIFSYEGAERKEAVVPTCKDVGKTYDITGDSIAFKFARLSSTPTAVTLRASYQKYYNCSTSDIGLKADFGRIDFKDFPRAAELACRWNLEAQSGKELFLFFFRLPKNPDQLKIGINGSGQHKSGPVGAQETVSYSADSKDSVSDFVIFYRRAKNASEIKVLKKEDAGVCEKKSCVLEVTKDEIGAHDFIEFSQRFAVAANTTTGATYDFHMHVQSFGFGHRDATGKCHYGEVSVFEGTGGIGPRSEPFLTLCGAWDPRRIQLPFSNATVKLRFAKPNDAGVLSVEEVSGIRMSFETVEVKKPDPQALAITNGTADLSVPVDEGGLYANNLDLRWSLRGDPDVSGRALMLRLQTVELATIPGLGICDNDRLTIASDRFRFSYCGEAGLGPRLFFSSEDHPLRLTFSSDDRHQGRGVTAEAAAVNAFEGVPGIPTAVSGPGVLLSPAFPAPMTAATFAGAGLAWELKATSCGAARLQLMAAGAEEGCKALVIDGAAPTWLCGNDTEPLEVRCGAKILWTNTEGGRLAAELTISPPEERTTTESPASTPQGTVPTSPEAPVTTTSRLDTTTAPLTTTPGHSLEDQKGGGLSSGAKAGIAIVCILLLLCLSYFCYHYYRGTLKESCVLRCFTERGNKQTPTVRYVAPRSGETNISFQD